MINQSLSFTHGGQTEIHKMRMLKQVAGTTMRVSLFIGFLVLVGYYLSQQKSTTICMYLFYGLAEVMELFRIILPKLKGFTYCVDVYDGSIFKCTVPYFLGSEYPYQVIQSLNKTLITGSIYALISSCVTALISIFYFVKKGRDLKNAKQMSGATLHSIKTYAKDFKKPCLKIDTIPIARDLEVKHFMVPGTTGSGKSNMMNHLIQAIEERGDKAVIVDTTGGFVEKFYNPERDMLLNPYDARTKDWCLWSEPLNESYEFTDIADSMIEKQTYDSFWTESARQALSEILKHVYRGSKSLSEALDILLTMPLSQAQQYFVGTPAMNFFSKESEKTTMSVRASLATQLSCLMSLQDIQEGFSITDWVKDDHQKGFLFLSGLPKQRAQLRPLWSLWFSLAVKAMMDLKPHSERRVWFIVDELASLSKLSCLDMALAEGRKYGACIVLGFQNLSQIQDIYGVRGTKSISELMVTKFVFQAVDFENAQMLSKFFGEKEYIESHENLSFGANEIRDGVSLSHHRKLEPVVRPSKLMELKPLEFYAKIQNVCLQANFSYFQKDPIAESFIPSKNKENTVETKMGRAYAQRIEHKEGNDIDNHCAQQSPIETGCNQIEQLEEVV
ncbi:MAG: type IV secretion system DNA-binding domain-containing protein [Alphaproteobacteria bacterium]|nr:type IV secretion system DNA-binding domain-containing protein [Alphaproteobacteria bacterium]